MLKRLWRNKKGQIQGVDFALAMIIFMIIFAEVIVLSLSYLQPKYLNLDNQAFESRTSQLSDTFFASTGYPSSWEYSYTTTFNSFGLRQIGTSALDANKISRITPRSLYSISYDNLIGNLTREEDLGFQFTISTLFEANSTLSLTQPLGSINIITSLGNCMTWCFVVAPNSTIIYTHKEGTDSTGLLNLNFDTGSGVLPDGYYTLVVFAESQKGIFAINYDHVIIGTEVNFGLKAIIQENSANNGEAVIQTQFLGAANSLSTIVLYPYQDGAELYGNDSQTITLPSSQEVFNLRIPTNGTCVALVTGINVLGFSRRTYIFPSILTSEFNTVCGPQYIPENESLVKIEQIVVIRECLFKAVLLVWPV